MLKFSKLDAQPKTSLYLCLVRSPTNNQSPIIAGDFRYPLAFDYHRTTGDFILDWRVISCIWWQTMNACLTLTVLFWPKPINGKKKNRGKISLVSGESAPKLRSFYSRVSVTLLYRVCDTFRSQLQVITISALQLKQTQAQTEDSHLVLTAHHHKK